MMTDESIDELRARTAGMSPSELLAWVDESFGKRAAFATSFGPEDQVLTDMIATVAPGLRIFTLDTGRLFEETYDLIERTSQCYGLPVQVYFPDAQDVERLVSESGVNLFRASLDDRKRCCFVRKVQPLGRALAELDVWVCGLRAAQSSTREGRSAIEWDAANGLVKISPLLDWNEEDVWAYIRANNVPYNRLHDEGFRSIGCAPCTRATLPGEDERAGRWWWESPEHKECGLHRPGGDPR